MAIFLHNSTLASLVVRKKATGKIFETQNACFLKWQFLHISTLASLVVKSAPQETFFRNAECLFVKMQVFTQVI